MRGLPVVCQVAYRGRHLVPAHAGVTRKHCQSIRLSTPRPRTCGGYPMRNGATVTAASSSPHMRGLPAHPARAVGDEVLVPAHVGVTRTSASTASAWASRPRTCGGYPNQRIYGKRLGLSSPHMRGLPAQDGGGTARRWPRPRTCGGYPWRLAQGPSMKASSPHMRGLPATKKRKPMGPQLVPAHAGVTRR